jgi:hypothetical protein
MTKRKQYPQQRIEAERRKQEHNARVILRDVMCRERFQSTVHDQLTEVLVKVASGQKLGSGKAKG